MLGVDLSMVAGLERADLAHSHTWYANMAGHLAKLLHGIPHVVTAHSLEPSRPWKAEQLGGGYRLSSWVEQTAYEGADAVIARQRGHAPGRAVAATRRWTRPRCTWSTTASTPASTTRTRPGTRWRPTGSTRTSRAWCSSDGSPGRRASATWSRPRTRSATTPRSCCAPARRTPRRSPRRPRRRSTRCSAARPGVIWVRGMLPTAQVRQILSQATVFVCPSVYEPLGIVNLEAMACGTAVVASDVGGIPEVVDDGRTGLLVHYDENAIDEFRSGIAAKVNELLADPDRTAAMGVAGRERAETRVHLARRRGQDGGDLPHVGLTGSPSGAVPSGPGPGPVRGHRGPVGAAGRAVAAGRVARGVGEHPRAPGSPRTGRAGLCRTPTPAWPARTRWLARTRSTTSADRRRVVQVPALAVVVGQVRLRPGRRPAAR